MGEMVKLRGWKQLVSPRVANYIEEKGSTYLSEDWRSYLQIAMRDCQYPAERETSHLRDNVLYLSNFGDTFV